MTDLMVHSAKTMTLDARRPVVSAMQAVDGQV